MQTYIKRITTTKIREKLGNIPGVVILGPRQCRKSTLAKAMISEIEGARGKENIKKKDLTPQPSTPQPSGFPVYPSFRRWKWKSFKALDDSSSASMSV
jgi:hypothetical protein